MEEGKLNQEEENKSPEKKLPQEKEERKCTEDNNISGAKNRGEKRPVEDASGLPELPAELKKMFKPLSCELCSVTVTSPVMAYSHYEGKSHLKNVSNYLKKHYNVENTFKKHKSTLKLIKCEICNLELSSEIVYKMHLTGKQHRKNLKRNEVPPPKITVEVDPTGRFNIGKAFTNEVPVTAPKNSELYCNICQVFTNTKTQMEIHEQGQKHVRKAGRILLQNSNTNSLQKSEEYYNEKNVWEPSPEESEN